jgi:hypothetical protein
VVDEEQPTTTEQPTCQPEEKGYSSPAVIIMVNGKVMAQKLCMLVDTESAVSSICAQKSYKLGLTIDKQQSPLLKSAGDNILKTKGITKVDLKIANTTIHLPIIVCNKVSFDFILGADALNKLDAIIDIPKKKLVLKKDSVDLLQNSQHPVKAIKVGTVTLSTTPESHCTIS